VDPLKGVDDEGDDSADDADDPLAGVDDDEPDAGAARKDGAPRR
jgi:hypothetical protein